MEFMFYFLSIVCFLSFVDDTFVNAVPTAELNVVFNSQEMSDLFGIVELRVPIHNSHDSDGSDSSGSGDSSDENSNNEDYYVTVLELLELACVDNNLLQFCLDFEISLRSNYGYYIKCISGICESQAESIYWFVYINNQLTDLSFGINNINVKSGDVVTISLEPYFAGLECATIDRPPVMLNNNINNNDLLGVWYTVRLNNLFNELVYVRLGRRCTTDTFELLDNTTNELTDLIVTTKGFLIEDTEFENEIVLSELTLDQLESNVAIYSGTNQNPVPFLTKIIYLTDNLQILWSCNENNPFFAGTWENLSILSRNPTITDDELNEITDVLYSMGVPVTQINLIDITIGCHQ